MLHAVMKHTRATGKKLIRLGYIISKLDKILSANVKEERCFEITLEARTGLFSPEGRVKFWNFFFREFFVCFNLRIFSIELSNFFLFIMRFEGRKKIYCILVNRLFEIKIKILSFKPLIIIYLLRIL